MNFIHNYIGKIATQFSKPNIEGSEHFGPLQIRFDDGSYLTFDENGDAETISVVIEPIEFNTESDTEYWSEVLLNWPEVTNVKLTQFKVLQSEENKVIACKLYFEKGKSLTYYNCYDDSKIAFENDSTLESFVEFEKLEWQVLRKLN